MKTLITMFLLIALFISAEFNATVSDMVALVIASVGILSLVFRDSRPVALLLRAALTAEGVMRRMAMRARSRLAHHA